MALTMDDLTINIGSFDQAELLSDWVWLIDPSRLPILVTAAGDVFLQDAGSGEVFFLDAQAGAVEPVAASLDGLRDLLKDREFVIAHLAIDMVGEMLALGRSLGPGEVFSFDKPLILGGQYGFDNVRPCDAAIHFSLLGQIHEQVAGMPPGTTISGINT